MVNGWERSWITLKSHNHGDQKRYFQFYTDSCEIEVRRESTKRRCYKSGYLCGSFFGGWGWGTWDINVCEHTSRDVYMGICVVRSQEYRQVFTTMTWGYPQIGDIPFVDSLTQCNLWYQGCALKFWSQSTPSFVSSFVASFVCKCIINM